MKFNHFHYRYLLGAILVSGVSLLFIAINTDSFNPGCSLLLGVVVALVPQRLFQKIACHKNKVQNSRQIMYSFYWAAIIKVLSLVALFILAVQWHNLQLSWFFGSFIFVQVFYWAVFLQWLHKGELS